VRPYAVNFAHSPPLQCDEILCRAPYNAGIAHPANRVDLPDSQHAPTEHAFGHSFSPSFHALTARIAIIYRRATDRVIIVVAFVFAIALTAITLVLGLVAIAIFIAIAFSLIFVLFTVKTVSNVA
jgi:hypothetical protein